ncbi:unnamed protein product [Diplocarpon coronariae]
MSGWKVNVPRYPWKRVYSSTDLWRGRGPDTDASAIQLSGGLRDRNGVSGGVLRRLESRIGRDALLRAEHIVTGLVTSRIRLTSFAGLASSRAKSERRKIHKSQGSKGDMAKGLCYAMLPSSSAQPYRCRKLTIPVLNRRLKGGQVSG